MQIIYSAQDSPQKWFKMFAKAFGASIKDNAFELPSSIGEGIFKQYYPFPGLSLSYLHFKVYKRIELLRQPVDESPLIPIMFYPIDLPFDQTVDQQKKQVGYHTANGTFVLSPQIESQWSISPNTWRYWVTITIEKDWALELLDSSKENYIYKVIKRGKPFYLFESLTPSMKQVICSIHELINSEDNLQKLKLNQKTLELLILFLQKVDQRTISKNQISINSSDIEYIFLIRKIILDNLPDTLSIKQLSIEAGMSARKLQSCFKQVFGQSISEFTLSEKMEQGKHLLETKKYSVSEVGYQLGYSNLSHFSKAFKNKFGITPKAFLSGLS